jgi:hypothetical protein
MASYVVMEEPGRRGTAEVTFLRDGFSWMAFLVAPLWLLWHRLWIEALLAFVALGLLSELVETGWPFAGSLPALLVSLFVGLEGRNLRIAALRRRGWREWGVLDAGNLSDAETRYADAVTDEEAIPDAPPSIVPGPAPARPAHAGLVLGLDPAPGGA